MRLFRRDPVERQREIDRERDREREREKERERERKRERVKEREREKENEIGRDSVSFVVNNKSYRKFFSVTCVRKFLPDW